MRRRASRMLRSSSTARTRGRSAGHDIVPASVSIIRPVSPTPWLRRVVEGATWLPRPGSRAKAGILRPSARDIRGNPDTDGAGIVTVPDTASQGRRRLSFWRDELPGKLPSFRATLARDTSDTFKSSRIAAPARAASTDRNSRSEMYIFFADSYIDGPSRARYALQYARAAWPTPRTREATKTIRSLNARERRLIPRSRAQGDAARVGRFHLAGHGGTGRDLLRL